MKILCISDVHGRDKWKDQVEFVDFDHCVFTGDYLDSFVIDGETQHQNFLEIIEFKRANPDKVTLLVGNHDVSYMDTFCQCSGYQNAKAYDFKILLDELYRNKEIQACKVIDNYLFVHAGITKTWFKKYEIATLMESLACSLEEAVNELFYNRVDAFCFQDQPKGVPIHAISYYGDNEWQSPCWVRPQSLVKDKIEGFIQVVGHTQVEKPVLFNDIWLTDCQESFDTPLILEI